MTSVSQILPPSNASAFFARQDYWQTRYGKDLVDWYNNALVEHGKRVISAISNALGASFPGADIGYKVPGVSWGMTNPSFPRAAEIDAGLIQTSIDDNADATGHGYQKVIGIGKQLSTASRPVDMYFTAVEEDDDTSVGGGWSQAKSLAFWIAKDAAAQGTSVKAENALSGGVTSDHGWDNIVNAFDWAPYVGLDTLRLADVTSGIGAARYTQFIQRYRPGPASMYIRGTNNAWASTPMTRTGNLWVATGVHFGPNSAQSFKFDTTGDWTKNYGASNQPSTAIANGGNIPVQSNTTYDISFNPSTLAYTSTPSQDPSVSLVGQNQQGVTTPDSGCAYVTNSTRGSVSEISPATRSVVAEIPTGAGANSIAIDKTGSHLYVANVTAHTISVIDTASNTVTANIALSGSPSGMVLSPDSATLYVNIFDQAAIMKVDRPHMPPHC